MARRILLSVVASSMVLGAALVGTSEAVGAERGAARPAPGPVLVVGGERVVALAGQAGARPSATRPGPVPGTTTVRLELALRPSHGAALRDLLAALYDPGSARYHHFLAPGAFARRFAPDAASTDRLRAFLVAHRLQVRVQPFALAVDGSASAVGHAFSVAFATYRSAGSRFVAAAGPLELPASVAEVVSGVLGATSAPAAEPHLVHFGRLRRTRGPSVTTAAGRQRPALALPRISTSSCPGATSEAAATGGVTLDQLSGHYGISPLLASGADGRGRTVAVYELAAHSSSDVSTFLSCYGLTTSVTVDQVDGGGTVQPGSGTTEANLDIEQVAMQAPGASIVSYEGPNTGSGNYDVWSQIVSDDRASVVSTSWGSCEGAAGGTVAAEGTVFAQAAAQGQTIVAASGDSGSEDCWPSGPDTTGVDFPASDPYVTGVGGTVLSGTNDAVWNTCFGATSVSCAQAQGHAGGGGLSSVFPEPSWQQVLDTYPASSAGCGAPSCRGVPDLSANAGTPEAIYDQGTWTAVGGTSAAAPLVAGLVADVEDTCAGPVGALDPSLYAFAGGAGYPAGISDVTVGGNDLTGAASGAYRAGPGYDLASGLGAPIGTGLACPEVTGITPTGAPAGSQVTVTGSNLGSARIDFGQGQAQVLSASATSATIVVPPGAGSVAVTAATPIGVGNTEARFSYLASGSAPVGGASSGGSGGGAASTGGSGGGGGQASGGGGASPIGIVAPPATLAGPFPAGGSPEPSPVVPVPPAAPVTSNRPVQAGRVHPAVGLRTALRGAVLELRWEPSAERSLIWGYLLVVSRCGPAPERCVVTRAGLGAGRTGAALHLVPGRYRLSLTTLGKKGQKATVTRSFFFGREPAKRGARSMAR